MLDITTSCRTCMKDNVTLVGLYEVVEIGENWLRLSDLLEQCTLIEITTEDGLPQHVCSACVKVLQLVYSFRKQAAEAHDEFKKLLQGTVKTEPEEVEIKTEMDHDYFSIYGNCNYKPNISIIEDKVNICTKCNKEFTNEKKYLKHLEAHKNVSLECDTCQKLYPNHILLEKHRAKHVNLNMCFVKEARLLDETGEHIQQDEVNKGNKSPVPTLKCTDCNQTYTKQRSLSMHMRKHRKKDEKQEYICDTCKKTFPKKHLLLRHVPMHSEVKPHKCEKCPKTYARRDQLISHMYSHKEQKPYVCEFCRKSFVQLCSLKDHIRTHTGETPYLCSDCGKGFANNSNLRQHMMRHTGAKPYPCNLCPKAFCTKGQMRAHVTTHSGDHPYKCEKCGAAFTKPNSLKKHSLIHLAIRPFACDTCGMRFTCKDHLKRHTRIHTGEKPYKCNHCDRAFSQSNDLVKHTRQHIGQNIYQCTICGSRFRLMSELKQHYPIHFSDDKNEARDPQNSTKDDTKPTANELKPADFNLLTFKNEKDLVKGPEVDKELTMLPLKPPDGAESDPVKSDTNLDRVIITTISCDTYGMVNGITIKLPK